MDHALIFAPVGALAFWTFVVLTLIPMRRFRAAFAGRVKAEDFKHGESVHVPGDVSIPNRAYMNLLEMPLLFYVVCLMFYVSDRVNGAILGVAWAYVALRVGQSLIHITYNNVFHRLSFFAVGNMVLGFLWLAFYLPLLDH